ncbi:hypothetical protein [Vibrio sp. CAU 1672]|uniref:hypothetical protein n=1 Tax=Vibrio sp. CAU 1672 TaxID=3032594 RepID=UPI0023DAF289|nr:hypothetical protein [Vibrio sp. CAU 1672]MDF2152116.1 hypothetical protein [Vibrio sp. CAU 1672]
MPLAEIIRSSLFWFIFGLVLAFTIMSARAYISRKNSNRTLFIESVALEKSKWRELFREEVAQFNALAVKHYYAVRDVESALADKLFAIHVEELNYLRVKVRLRLNPNELIHSYDAKLVRSMSRVILQFETKQYEGLNRELLRIERCAQRILKNEWEKSKSEAESGEMVTRHRLPTDK